MLTRRHLVAAALTFAAWFALGEPTFPTRAAAELSDRISDQEFWTLTEQLSEPNGFFRSDNFLSNERGYQTVIPELVSTTKPGGVYLGVGPEQNFTYIAALKSRMAFIIDIRRGNLHEHLLYKALFEMAGTRADFLGLLFSRKRPDGLSERSSVAELFRAYVGVDASETLYKENLKAVIDRLTKTHGFRLTDDDVSGIDYVYREAFYVGGPTLDYSSGRGGNRPGNFPSYQELMLAHDGSGRNRSYLTNEETFAFLKSFEERNLLVPVVGNFAGPKAIRAVGRYVRDHGGVVNAFYLSNVEQFLAQDGIWGTFCASVATLPLDETSTYIYSGRGAPLAGTSSGFGRGAFGLQTAIRPMQREVKVCA
jgi:hypothetical protein